MSPPVTLLFVALANDRPAFRYLVEHFVTRARFFYVESVTVAAFSVLL